MGGENNEWKRWPRAPLTSIRLAARVLPLAGSSCIRTLASATATDVTVSGTSVLFRWTPWPSTFLFSTFSPRDNIKLIGDLRLILLQVFDHVTECNNKRLIHQALDHDLVANVGDATMLCPSVAVLNSRPTTNRRCDN